MSAINGLSLQIHARNLCAVIAVIGQESSFEADPKVPGLGKIARREIEARRQRIGVPESVLDWGFSLSSSDGRSYRERLDACRTENELSLIFEEIPGGSSILSRFNPVRTGGPMQVGIAFAEEHAKERSYPYSPMQKIRREVFTRRGGVYFGAAHLLDYRSPYKEMRYRFADFNAGRFSCRNAAFQQAVSSITGTPIALDGDLSPADGVEMGETFRSLKPLHSTLGLSDSDIVRDLQLEKSASFSDTLVYGRVFALADTIAQGGRAPRAVIPEIELNGPKIERKLSTKWFANRVNRRFQDCMSKAEQLDGAR